MLRKVWKDIYTNCNVDGQVPVANDRVREGVILHLSKCDFMSGKSKERRV